jgi:hypothetical protein
MEGLRDAVMAAFADGHRYVPMRRLGYGRQRRPSLVGILKGYAPRPLGGFQRGDHLTDPVAVVGTAHLWSSIRP